MLVTVYQRLLTAQAYAIALIREMEERSSPAVSAQLDAADLPLQLEHERHYNERLAYWQGVAGLPEEV
jgi:hypothetical protein